MPKKTFSLQPVLNHMVTRKRSCVPVGSRCRAELLVSLFSIFSWWRSWQGISPAQTAHVSIVGGDQRPALGSTLSGTVATSMAAETSQSVEQTPEIQQACPLYALPDNTR